jgi:DNA-directed RNA polymerase I subunit RPA43
VTDEWEFEYGPAENDPEFAPAVQGEADETPKEKQLETNGHSSGKWVHKTTGDNLGGPSGRLEFTVIGYVV